MDFISNEAEDDIPNLHVSEDEAEENNDNSSFIDDTPVEQESIRVHRDLTNLEYYPKFKGQARSPLDATYSGVHNYFGEDEQPELYNPENRNFVEFDRFDKFEQNVEKLKNTLLKFDGVENHLFFAVIYGLMYQKTENKDTIKKEDAQKILGNDLYFELLEIEPSTLLDQSLFGFFLKVLFYKSSNSKVWVFLKIF